MPGSILAQMAQAPVAGALPGLVGIGTFAYLMYKTLVEKERKFMEQMHGMRAIVPLAILVVLTIIPATTLALFGPAEAIMTAILEIATLGLIGYVGGLAVYQFIARFAPEYLE